MKTGILQYNGTLGMKVYKLTKS